MTRRDFMRRLFPAIVGVAIAPTVTAEVLKGTVFSFGSLKPSSGRWITNLNTGYWGDIQYRIYGPIARALATETPYLNVLNQGIYPGIKFALDSDPVRFEFVDRIVKPESFSSKVSRIADKICADLGDLRIDG